MPGCHNCSAQCGDAPRRRATHGGHSQRCMPGQLGPNPWGASNTQPSNVAALQQRPLLFPARNSFAAFGAWGRRLWLQLPEILPDRFGKASAACPQSGSKGQATRRPAAAWLAPLSLSWARKTIVFSPAIAPANHGWALLSVSDARMACREACRNARCAPCATGLFELTSVYQSDRCIFKMAKSKNHTAANQSAKAHK